MIFRYARHTNQLAKIVKFYTTILLLEKIGDFKNHNGYDGVFIGKKCFDWHLEFTTSNEIVSHTFDDDDCLVFYPTSSANYDEIIETLVKNNINLEIPKNPYWKENGIQIKDPDGFNIIISKQKIL